MYEVTPRIKVSAELVGATQAGIFYQDIFRERTR